MKRSMVVALGALALAGGAGADTVTWTGGANGLGGSWTESCWDAGGLPGTQDTAVFEDIDRFKTLVMQGRNQTIALENDVEILGITFKNLYGVNVMGAQKTLTLNAILAQSVTPTVEDLISVATNKLSVSTLTLKGATATIEVGENHVLDIASNTLSVNEGTSIEKTGSGLLVLSGAFFEPANPLGTSLWVKEGRLSRTGNGYPSLKVGRVIVGGDGSNASIDFGSGTHITKFPAWGFVDVRAGGRIGFGSNPPGEQYLERLSIDHGVVDASGSQFTMSNDSATSDQGAEYVFKGGVLQNGSILLNNASSTGKLTIYADDDPSYIYGTLKTTFGNGSDIDVPDGSAFVDFVIVGDLSAGNRYFHKTGAGTLAVRCTEQISTWSGAAGRPFEVNGGAFYFESSETAGIGMGTNNVVVAAGATYGAVGRHVGAYVNLRGNIGNVILNGAAETETKTTFAIGRIDVETGALAHGTYVIGSEEHVGNVTFNTAGTLKIAADASGVSGLVVNGTFTLSGNDELAIVGPAHPRQILPGTYEIVKTREPMNEDFASVTYNGGALPSNLKVRKVSSTLITLCAAPKGLTIVLR